MLDADVDGVETVVAQDDVDQVLADVMNIASNGGEQNFALAGVCGLFDVRFEVCDSRFHHLGALQNERQLHFTLAE